MCNFSKSVYTFSFLRTFSFFYSLSVWVVWPPGGQGEGTCGVGVDQILFTSWVLVVVPKKKVVMLSQRNHNNLFFGTKTQELSFSW